MLRFRSIGFVAFILLGDLACGGDSPPARPATASTVPAPATTATTGGGVRAGATPSPLPPGTTSKRTVVTQGRISGTDVIVVQPGGLMTIVHDYLENGRGPHVEAALRFAADGTPTQISASGHHILGTKVAESFIVRDGKAIWKSNEETGERPVNPNKPAFFLPLAAMPATVGFLAQAALKNGGRIDLLPVGEATIEKTGLDASITSKSGETRHIVSYTIAGLDLVPVHVWLNDDNTWFGTFAPWISYVPEGFEGNVDALIQKQTQHDRDRDLKVAKANTRRPPNGVAFIHARVLDVATGKYKEDHAVIVAGETIKAVGPSATTKPPANFEVIDLQNKRAILPGLWDMHAHLSDADGVMHIASGVTTVRDVGNDPDKLDDWKRRYDEGSAVGPKVLRFGFIEGRNDKAAASKVTAETPEEARAAVETYARRGYEGIKIYNSMKPELVPLLAKEAHARKMLVTGHIPVHMLANEAVKAGYDGIEHINMLFLNFFADHDTDTRTTTRFTLVGDKAAGFDLKSQPAQDFFNLLKTKKTVIDPTVAVFQDLLLGQQGRITPGLEPLVARLPVQPQRQYLYGGLPLDGKRELYEQSYAKVLAMLKTLYDQKVPLVVGTDALAGLALHYELQMYVKAGIPAADAIRMASLDAAKTMGQEKNRGSIAEGKAADLFIVNGDPLTKIDDIGKVETVLKNGTIYSSKALYDTVNVKPL